MKTETIYTWRDLETYGINALTGESCSYGLRLLCDLNAAGVGLLSEFFGTDVSNTPPWNSQVNDRPTFASIMLPKDLLFPLAKYILFREGYVAVIRFQNQIIGVDEVALGRYQRLVDSSKLDIYRNHASPNAVKGRNSHQMSGRVA